MWVVAKKQWIFEPSPTFNTITDYPQLQYSTPPNNTQRHHQNQPQTHLNTFQIIQILFSSPSSIHLTLPFLVLPHHSQLNMSTQTTQPAQTDIVFPPEIADNLFSLLPLWCRNHILFNWCREFLLAKDGEGPVATMAIIETITRLNFRTFKDINKQGPPTLSRLNPSPILPSLGTS